MATTKETSFRHQKAIDLKKSGKISPQYKVEKLPAVKKGLRIAGLIYHTHPGARLNPGRRAG